MLNYRDDYFEVFDESEIEDVTNALIDHINNKGEGSILDYILDFCESNSYRVEEIAQLIVENKTFKNILKQDCIYHGIFRNKTEGEMDEWD